MDTLITFFHQFIAYMNSGGFVMWPLFILVFVLWYGLGYRYHTIQRGTKKSPRVLIRKFVSGKRENPKAIVDSAVVDGLQLKEEIQDRKLLRNFLDDKFFEYKTTLNQYSKLVKTVVIVAPLIGLLGTVIGMIETFDSLASMSLFSQSGGIAGGISQALFTTQLGLVVAVPGLVIGRLLDKKASQMELDLEQIKDILCSEENLDEI
ncbi:MotA/TolQ/ExbB proton channel family protein [Sulfurimonas sp.]|uniref:MotA/TolQ/ExbB proton channel family protein n=1 Tax=Sulfurimonas sp. TaxID=2022749 RepID=UPI003D0A5A50